MIRAKEPIFDLTAMASSLVDVLTSKPYDMTSEAGLAIHAVECLKVQVRNRYNKSCNKLHKFENNRRPDPCGCFFRGQISDLAKRSPPECLRSLDCRMVSWFTKGQVGLRMFASTAARYATQKCEDKAVFLVNHMVRKIYSCVLLGPSFEDADVFG